MTAGCCVFPTHQLFLRGLVATADSSSQQREAGAELDGFEAVWGGRSEAVSELNVQEQDTDPSLTIHGTGRFAGKARPYLKTS